MDRIVRDNTVSDLFLMGHGVSLDYDAVVSFVPEYTIKQGLRASDLARRLHKVLEEHAHARGGG